MRKREAAHDMHAGDARRRRPQEMRTGDAHRKCAKLGAASPYATYWAKNSSPRYEQKPPARERTSRSRLLAERVEPKTAGSFGEMMARTAAIAASTGLHPQAPYQRGLNIPDTTYLVLLMLSNAL